MFIDVIFPGWVQRAVLGTAEDVAGYTKAHDKALAYEFDVLVSGHLTRPGDRPNAENSKAYILELDRSRTEA
jgi:hypothetical protein